MKILNTVEYTIWSKAQSAHIQCQVILPHTRKLTYRGAERIIRRTVPGAIVTMVQSASYA